MNNENLRSVLSALCETGGITGKETSLHPYLISLLSPHADRYATDELGNLYFFRGASPKRMLCAAIDVPGFICRYVSPQEGGVRAYLACPTEIPACFSDEKDFCTARTAGGETVRFSVKENAFSLPRGDIRVGDEVYPVCKCVCGGGLLSSPLLPYRLGAAILCAAMLKDSDADGVCFAFLAQSLVANRGAAVAAHRLPRMDTLALTALPRSDEKTCSRDVPALLLRDRSCIYAPASLRRLQEKAVEGGIPVGYIADTKTVGCGATLQAEGGHTVGSIAVPLEQFGDKQAPFVTETAVEGALALALAWMK